MEPHDLEGYVRPEHYDLYYTFYTVDVAFYVGLAKAARGPVLEVGCGTGRILIPTLQAGVDIDGLDVQPGMLAVLTRKAEALGLKPAVYAADMRDFTMPRRYALVTIPFRAFMHLLTTEDQIAALRCIREHLVSGGALVFNLWYPSFERIVGAGEEPRLEQEFPHPESGLPVGLYATNRYDRLHQILEGTRELRISDARGYVAETLHDRLRIRWTYLPEMELVLRAAGFTHFEVKGGFDGRPLERHTDEMVWTAWKD